MANLIRRENREPARSGTSEYNLDPFRGWDPFRMMDSLLRWDPFAETGGWLSRGGASFVPHFDVKETKDGYFFRADLPGVKEADLEIAVTGNVLTVSGRREDAATTPRRKSMTYASAGGGHASPFSFPCGYAVAELLLLRSTR